MGLFGFNINFGSSQKNTHILAGNFETVKFGADPKPDKISETIPTKNKEDSPPPDPETNGGKPNKFGQRFDQFFLTGK